MTFDPFGDFESRGYLRNKAKLHDPAAVKEFEHAAFLDKLEDTVRHLTRIDQLTYKDVLAVHGSLFEDVYPWAGQDRSQTAPDKAVSKGSVLFAHPSDTRAAVDYALRIGNDPASMAAKPGEMMGYLAYGHPFLDGNGRTIMVVHAELARRAGISVDWAATDKVDYLKALTRELDRPGHGQLDAYLKPFIGPAIGPDRLAGHIARVQGLDGASKPLHPNEVLGRFSDPVLMARYQAQQQRRDDQQRTASPTPRTAASDAAQANVPAEKETERQATQEKTGKDFAATRDPAAHGRDRTRDRDSGNGGGRGGRGR